MESLIQCASNTHTAASWSELKMIHGQHINVVHFPRSITRLQKDIQELISLDFEYRLEGSIHQLTEKLMVLDEFKGVGDKMVQDIKHLMQEFSLLCPSSDLRLLLATLDHNMCRKFHTDNHHVRLLCTYHGPGTLWVESQEPVRVSDIHSSSIRSSEAGDVILLKGGQHPNKIQAAIHRSPGIEESQQKRLLLRLDHMPL